MTTLVVGASGATGRLLTQNLLDRGESVRIIVRSIDSLPDIMLSHKNLSVTVADLLALSDTEMNMHVNGCHAIASCLGHNMTFKGMFCPPRRLVTEATRRLCQAATTGQAAKPVKFVLMNTTGNRNRDLDEPISLAQRCVVGLIRLLLPPHADNEAAADYLRVELGQSNEAIEWAVVRPDSLTDESEITEIEVHPSPIRSAIFDAGSTSRINVAGFMADLIIEDHIWAQWKGTMPVIYNIGG